jgi:hypothetical protein
MGVDNVFFEKLNHKQKALFMHRTGLWEESKLGIQIFELEISCKLPMHLVQQTLSVLQPQE